MNRFAKGVEIGRNERSEITKPCVWVLVDLLLASPYGVTVIPTWVPVMPPSDTGSVWPGPTVLKVILNRCRPRSRLLKVYGPGSTAAPSELLKVTVPR